MIATSTIKAGNQANVTALGNLSVQGGDVQAKDINLIALGDVTLTGVQNKQVYGGGNDTTTVTTTQSLNLKGDNINIQGVGASSDVTLVAANVDAANKAKIAGSGDVTIASAENRTTHEWTTTNKDCNWWGKCTTTVTHGVEDKTTQVGSDVKGASVEISAGKDLTTVASTIEGGNVNLSAQGKIDYLAALNVDKKDVQSNSSSSWMGMDIRWFSLYATAKSESKDSSIQTRAAATSLQSEADILSESGGNTRLQGTQVKAQTFTVNAGVGAGADPNAKVIIEGVKETLQTSHTEKSESVMWQSMSGNGGTTETLALANIQAKTKFSAPGGIDVQLPAGDPLKEQIKTLSQQPGMAWLNELSQRKDVNWQEIKLAKDKWDYSHEGLTPAGAIIVAIVIAIATAGAGAEASAALMTEAEAAAAMAEAQAAAAAAGASTTTITAAQAAALAAPMQTAIFQAGITTLASQSGVSFVNNGGDIGKTFKDMGSKDSVRNVVLAMATAGVLSDLNSTMGLDKVKVTDGFTANLNKAIVNNLANATMTSAITGTPLEDNIKTGLVSAFISAGAGQTAYEIGNQTANDQMAKALAHAIAGCVAGAAGQGKGGCSAGATGAVVGELAAQWYDPNGTKKPEDTLNFVKVITAAAAAITGDGSAASVSTAVMTGVNAAQNNYLKHTQVALLADKLKNCGADASCKNNAMDEAYRQSSANDAALLNCKATNNCEQLKTEYRQGMQAIVNLMDSGLPTNDVARVLNLENTAQTIIRFDLDQKTCVTASCKENASYLTGVGQGLAKITPVGLAVGTGVMAYELSMALVNNGAVDTAVKLAQGIQDLPANIRAGLNSSDPAVRGEALVDALSFGAAGAALATKITTTAIATATPAVIAALDKSATNALVKSGGAIDAQTGNALLDMSTLSNAQKGAMGDLFGASTVKQIVPEGQKLARIQSVGTTGIDDLYKVNRPDVDYVVIEYKFVGQDSKTGAQVLSNTNDGLQGSLSWIGGSNRIEKAVGDDAAAGIKAAINSGRAESWVVTTRPDGSTSVQVLDAMGKPKPTDTSKILLPGVNLSGAKP